LARNGKYAKFYNLQAMSEAEKPGLTLEEEIALNETKLLPPFFPFPRSRTAPKSRASLFNLYWRLKFGWLAIGRANHVHRIIDVLKKPNQRVTHSFNDVELS